MGQQRLGESQRQVVRVLSPGNAGEVVGKSQSPKSQVQSPPPSGLWTLDIRHWALVSFLPAACAGTGSHRGLSVCSRAASPTDQSPRQFQLPAASRKTAPECNLRPSPWLLRRRARAVTPDL